MRNYKLWFCLLFVFLCFQAEAKNLPAYQIYDKAGIPKSFSDLSASAMQNQIVFFGELHNNPIGHWLQMELSIVLHNQIQDAFIVGMEMFESDNQLLIDEYFSGLINERSFTSEARTWNNYSTDIRPLVEYARENSIRLVATNIPRRYASLVNRAGFGALEKLSDKAKNYLPPLSVPYDPELPGYKALSEMPGMPTHTSMENFPKAQAIKDATMAHFILKHFQPGDLFLHINGSYHSSKHEGIVWYLLQQEPSLEIMTVEVVEQNQLIRLHDDHKGIADYIIVVPANMTKTF